MSCFVWQGAHYWGWLSHLSRLVLRVETLVVLIRMFCVYVLYVLCLCFAWDNFQTTNIDTYTYVLDLITQTTHRNGNYYNLIRSGLYKVVFHLLSQIIKFHFFIIDISYADYKTEEIFWKYEKEKKTAAILAKTRVFVFFVFSKTFFGFVISIWNVNDY